MAVSQQRELQFTLTIVDDPKDPVKLVVVDPPTAATVEKGKLVIPMKDVNDMPDYFVLFDVEVVVSMVSHSYWQSQSLLHWSSSQMQKSMVIFSL